MDVDNMVYENESYTAHFKDQVTASDWATAKVKLLEDAGLTVTSMNISTMNKYNKHGYPTGTVGYSATVRAQRGEAINISYYGEEDIACG